ncbi:hypothetical protein ACEPAI_7183 [Sanghuangporus weigelae]
MSLPQSAGDPGASRVGAHDVPTSSRSTTTDATPIMPYDELVAVLQKLELQVAVLSSSSEQHGASGATGDAAPCYTAKDYSESESISALNSINIRDGR